MKSRKMIRLPALLLAAALLIWLAAGAFLRWGWPRDLFRLEDQTGDAAALCDFTISGRLSTPMSMGQTFLLRDGTVRTRVYWTEDDLRAARGDYYFSDRCLSALPEEERAAAEAGAEYQAYYASGGSWLQSTQRGGQYIFVNTSRVQRMQELEIGPGRDTRCLRLDLGTVTLDEPVMLQGEWMDDGTAQDYGAYEVGSSSLGLCRLLMDGCYYFSIEDPIAPANSGLWRVEEALTEEELAALPKTVEIGGVPALPNTAAYGKAARLWTAPEGWEICGLTSADGSICVLLQDGAAETRLVVLDADGNLCDSVDLGCFPQSDTVTEGMTVYPDLSLDGTARQDEISVVYRGAEGESGGLRQALQLRIENGRITAVVRCASEAQSGAGWYGMALNEDATRLLVVTGETQEITYYPRSDKVAVGTIAGNVACRLAVYEVENGEAAGLLYTGRLWTGESLFDRGSLIPRKTNRRSLLVSEFDGTAWLTMNNVAEQQALWPEVTEG